MVEVRPFTEADIPALLDMARRMHAESPRFARFTFSPRKCEQIMRNLLGNPQAGGILVAKKAGIIVGMVVPLVVEHFFGVEKTASDLAVYVAPEHRGGSIVVRLVRAFEKFARERAAVEAALGVSTEIHADRTVELYRGLGYRLSGYIMVKELF